MKKDNIVKVSADIHKKITGKNNRYVKCFALGLNNKKVIDTLLPIRAGCTGCDWMPNLPANSLSKCMVELAKLDRKFIGFARIHGFESHTENRGYGLSTLFKLNPQAICISYNKENFRVETKRGKFLKYVVV
jgi:hypothetical protein